MTDISIILCTHNGKTHLRPTIEHIAKQDTRLSWEFVLVDVMSVYWEGKSMGGVLPSIYCTFRMEMDATVLDVDKIGYPSLYS